MTDREFLRWIRARLMLKGDNESADFMRKLAAIAETLPPSQRTTTS